jgi:hypothetical protein
MDADYSNFDSFRVVTPLHHVRDDWMRACRDAWTSFSVNARSLFLPSKVFVPGLDGQAHPRSRVVR